MDTNLSQLSFIFSHYPSPTLLISSAGVN